MFKKILAFICLALIPAISAAATFGIFETVEDKPISELWLNPGFYSYHFQKNKGLSNSNFGLGAEYRYSTVSSVTLGVLGNSDHQTSHYVGWYWRPLGLGHARLGAVVGIIDGYPKMLDGGWFLAAIPTVSIDYKNVGANLMIVSGYKDKLLGSISLQLKLRVF